MNKKGFTLIELLAVIIILGILMIVAIPAVTSYIQDSRKETYVDTIKQIIASTRNYVNQGKTDMFDVEMTYYLPLNCINTENENQSPYGRFLEDEAYVIVGFDGKGYDYAFYGRDETGHGVKEIVSYDDLNADRIESDIQKSDIKTNESFGERIKIRVYENDCLTIKREGYSYYEATFLSNGGMFNNSSTSNLLQFSSNQPSDEIVKYSHTSNVNDAGNKVSNYGNSWGNSNITGTERGDTSKAHVITFPDASSLKVRLSFGGESVTYDWVCMWVGNHPNYNASNNCDTSLTGKLGGGNHTSLSNIKEYTIPGNSVTFSFRSDSSGWGDGYGYYAAVTEGARYEGDYLEPTRENYSFKGWEKDGVIYPTFASIKPNESGTYTAVWAGNTTLSINPNGGNVTVDGSTKKSTVNLTKSAGNKVSYGKPSKSNVTAEVGSYNVTYNSNGGSTTPRNQRSVLRQTSSYTFNNWETSGTCGVFSSLTGAGNYTFPESAGESCTMNATYNETKGSVTSSTVRLSAAKKPGYHITGWQSSSDGTVYNISSTFTPTEDTTMTAVWAEGEESSIAVFPSGKNKTTVSIGDKVYIGTEEFYVVKPATTLDGDLVLLARYNLKVGDIYNNTTWLWHYTYKSSDDNYGIQDSEMKGFFSGLPSNTLYNGVIKFSSTNYWNGNVGDDKKYPGSYSGPNYPYVYDKNDSRCTIATYVENYRDYIESMGQEVRDARILSCEEVKALGCNCGSLSCSARPFVVETDYWLGSATGNSTVYSMYSNNYNYWHNSLFGVRPVIII